MQIDMEGQVSEWINNNEGLYVALREVMQDCYDDPTFSDEENISTIADELEILVRDFYLSGNETPAGDWLIRSMLDSVGWYRLATLEYGDFLSDMGD